MATEWKLSGTYFEACNCDVACPCVFLSAPSSGECTALIGWHIDQGSFGDVVLDGLNVALAVHSPGHMLDVKWKVALYLDDKADQTQNQALTQIFAGQAGGHPARLGAHIGEVLGVKSVGIDYQVNGKRRSIQIADVAEAEIEAIEGQGATEVTVENHPLCIAPGYPAVTAKSKKLSYQDYGLQWQITEKNGFFSPFTYQEV
jgi:hypothetical protein